MAHFSNNSISVNQMFIPCEFQRASDKISTGLDFSLAVDFFL